MRMLCQGFQDRQAAQQMGPQAKGVGVPQEAQRRVVVIQEIRVRQREQLGRWLSQGALMGCP